MKFFFSILIFSLNIHNSFQLFKDTIIDENFMTLNNYNQHILKDRKLT